MAHVHDEILPAIKWGKWQSFKLLRYNRLKLLRIPPVNTLPYGGQIKSSWGKRWGSELSADLTNGIIHFNMQTLAACGQPNYGVCSLRIRTATLQRNKEKTVGQRVMTSGTKPWTSAVRKTRWWLCGLVTWPLCWSRFPPNSSFPKQWFCVAGGTVCVCVCVPVCKQMSVCVCVRVHMHGYGVCVCVWVCACVRSCMRSVCARVCVCAYMHECMPCMCVCMRVHACMCVCGCVSEWLFVCLYLLALSIWPSIRHSGLFPYVKISQQ